MADTNLLTPTEAEAAELEGLKPMPEDLIPLRDEKVVLDEEIAKLTARKNEIKDIFGARLKEDDAVAYVLYGKAHARHVVSMRSDVDPKLLREKFPHIWKQVLRTKEIHSIRVN